MAVIKDWAPILISLIALLGVQGWVMYFLNRYRQKREKYQTLLENFLIPFQDRLVQTRGISKQLVDKPSLGIPPHLEYFPKELEKHFASLPDSDTRKWVWKERIERLHAENHFAIELLDHYGGKIVTPEFRNACEKFRFHANEWEDVWKSKDGQPPSRGNDIPYRANPFPDELEMALKSEIDEVERLSG